MNNSLDFFFGVSTLIGPVIVGGVIGLAVGIPDGDCFSASKSDFRVRTEISGALGLGEDGGVGIEKDGGKVGRDGTDGARGAKDGREGITGGGGGITGRGGRGGKGGSDGRSPPSRDSGLCPPKPASAGEGGGVGREKESFLVSGSSGIGRLAGGWGF